MSHAHRWYQLVRQNLTSFRICLSCSAVEECPLPAGYIAASAAEAPACILPIATQQMRLWDTP
jgi:hypothetical protein